MPLKAQNDCKKLGGMPPEAPTGFACAFRSLQNKWGYKKNISTLYLLICL